MNAKTICDFIVPIYKRDDFIGTGFIVGNKLITAAHVVQVPTLAYFFLFENEKIRLSCVNMLWHEYYGDTYLQGTDNLYWDLAIYKLASIDSPIEFAALDSNSVCLYQGFSFNTTEHSHLIDFYNDIKVHGDTWYYPRSGAKRIRIDNCLFADDGKCKDGNSGGPLFQGDKVVGMLVGEQCHSETKKDRYIKSEYIMSRLNSLND